MSRTEDFDVVIIGSGVLGGLLLLSAEGGAEGGRIGSLGGSRGRPHGP